MALSFRGTIRPKLTGYAMEEGEPWRHSLLPAMAVEKVSGAVGNARIDPLQFSGVLIEAVAIHNRPPIADGYGLSALVHVADVVSHGSGSCAGWGGFTVRSDEEALHALGIGPIEIQNIIMDTYDNVAEVESMTSVA